MTVKHSDRARYCHLCGRAFAGPLAERVHTCDDRPEISRISPFVQRAREGLLPAKRLG